MVHANGVAHIIIDTIPTSIPIQRVHCSSLTVLLLLCHSTQHSQGTDAIQYILSYTPLRQHQHIRLTHLYFQQYETSQEGLQSMITLQITTPTTDWVFIREPSIATLHSSLHTSLDRVSILQNSVYTYFPSIRHTSRRN
jgi:hypothetical protein